MKKNGGITLIALVITIIVLLILAMVSINAIVGENGIISQAMEGRIVTLIADIIFKLEDNIVDINTENMLQNKVSIASDVMKELENRKLLLKNENTGLNFFSSTMQQQINDNRIVPLYLGFNGDIWYNNSKRGKVNLSSKSMTLVSSTTGAKITVNDGTIEELIPDYKYYLHSLEDRDDFVCWLNSYGEIVSSYKDTIIYMNIPRDEEFTAVYDKKMKLELAKSNPTLSKYIEWSDFDYEGEDISFQSILGLNSSIVKKGNEVYFEAQVTHNKFTNFYRDKILGEEDNCILNNGIKVTDIEIIVSDRYEDLILDEDGCFPFESDDWDYGDDDFFDEEYFEGINITMFPKDSNHYIEENLNEEEFKEKLERVRKEYGDYNNQYNYEWDKYSKFDYFDEYYSEYEREEIIDEYEQYYKDNKKVEEVPEEEREEYEKYKKFLDFKKYYDDEYDIKNIPENYQKEYKRYKKAIDFINYYSIDSEKYFDEDGYFNSEYEIENVPEEYMEEYREYKKVRDFKWLYSIGLVDRYDSDYEEECKLIEKEYSWDEYYDYIDYKDWYDSVIDVYASYVGYIKDTEQWPWNLKIENEDEGYYYSYGPFYITVVNYDDRETPKNVFENKWSPSVGKNCETTIPIINNENNLKYTSEIDFISTNISDMVSDFVKKDGTNRLYYRVVVGYSDMIMINDGSFSLNDAYGDNSGEYEELTDFGWYSSSMQDEYYSSVIKYIDL